MLLRHLLKSILLSLPFLYTSIDHNFPILASHFFILCKCQIDECIHEMIITGGWMVHILNRNSLLLWHSDSSKKIAFGCIYEITVQISMGVGGTRTLLEKNENWVGVVLLFNELFFVRSFVKYSDILLNLACVCQLRYPAPLHDLRYLMRYLCEVSYDMYLHFIV